MFVIFFRKVFFIDIDRQMHFIIPGFKKKMSEKMRGGIGKLAKQESFPVIGNRSRVMYQSESFTGKLKRGKENSLNWRGNVFLICNIRSFKWGL